MVDRNQTISDIITTINNLSKFDMSQDFPLDPPEISLIMSSNMKHLELEKNKGGFTSEELSRIETAISDADNFIKNNPTNNGGGGSISGGVVLFQDCLKGFIFALDFSPEEPLLTVGQVFNISSNGYKGCGQVMPKQDKQPSAPYTKPTLISEHKTCEECNKTL